MSNFTNLLPRDRVRALSRDYLLRLLTLIGAATTVLVAIHGALLVPSYVYLSEEVQTRKDHLADLSTMFGSSEERALGERATLVQTQSQALLQLTSRAETVPVLEELLLLSRSGVFVTGLSITPSLAGEESKLSVSGVASTRESLRRYHQAVSALSFVSKADLPLSVYASESEIPFTITITATLP